MFRSTPSRHPDEYVGLLFSRIRFQDLIERSMSSGILAEFLLPLRGDEQARDWWPCFHQPFSGPMRPLKPVISPISVVTMPIFANSLFDPGSF